MGHRTPTGNPGPNRIGESKRDYPHSSGDRNTKTSEGDWPRFEGGEQRDAGTDEPSHDGDKQA